MSLSLEKDKICRTCLLENEDMTCVFSMPEFEQTGTRVCDLILLCASVQIQEGDGLPEQVCTGCIAEMKKAFIFRKLCEKSDAVLRDKLNSTQNIELHIKAEPQIDLEDEPINIINFIKVECVNDDYKVELTDSETNLDVDPMEYELNYNEVKMSADEAEISADETEMSSDEAEMRAAAQKVTDNLLPHKSKEVYLKAYQGFKDFCNTKNVTRISERVLLAYFQDYSANKKPSTLWSHYSMLKATIVLRENIDISKFFKLVSHLKRQNKQYKGKKSLGFTQSEITQFLMEAPDESYITMKTVLIIGVAGSCSCDEICNMLVADLDIKSNIIVIKVPTSKDGSFRKFVVQEPWIDILKKYLKFRPTPDLPKLFISIRNGKATRQHIGHNTIGQMPKKVALFLNLPNTSSYTGHSFRRSSATILAGSSKQTYS